MPEEGGFYLWTKRAFGEWHGFVAAWTYWLSNIVWIPTVLFTASLVFLYVFAEQMARTYLQSLVYWCLRSKHPLVCHRLKYLWLKTWKVDSKYRGNFYLDYYNSTICSRRSVCHPIWKLSSY